MRTGSNAPTHNWCKNTTIEPTQPLFAENSKECVEGRAITSAGSSSLVAHLHWEIVRNDIHWCYSSITCVERKAYNDRSYTCVHKVNVYAATA